MGVAAGEPAVEKLLTAPTNTSLEKKGGDMQDVSVRKIQIQTKVNKRHIAANARKSVICWNIKKKQKKGDDT